MIRCFCCKPKSQHKKRKKRSDFWLVSIPPAGSEADSKDKTFKQLLKSTKYHADGYELPLPELKVSTLNQLMSLSDNLAKTDGLVEGVVRKIGVFIIEMQPLDAILKPEEVLKVNGMSMYSFIKKFHWNEARYPLEQNQLNICDLINEQTVEIDNAFRNKSANYTGLVSAKENLEKKTTGSLLTRELHTLVKPRHFVMDSDYLVSYMVLVPKQKLNEWKYCYETLTDMVVPRSSKIIYYDKEYFLCNVTVFRKEAEQFKQKARERKFIIRDFDMEKMKENPVAMLDTLSDRIKKNYTPTRQWMMNAFSVCFSAWMHIKIMRVFTESVLKYGLPVNYLSVVFALEPKKDKKLKKVLDKLYESLDPQPLRNPKINQELAGLGFGAVTNEYTPFVLFKMNIQMA